MSGKVGMRRMLPLLATGLAIALPSVLAPAALARTSLAPASESATTLNPVGGIHERFFAGIRTRGRRSRHR